MHREIIFISIVFFNVLMAKAQVQKLSFDQLEERVSLSSSDTNYVVNFWATWCGPCTKELPNFKAAQTDLELTNVKYVFVSLDFPKAEKQALNVFNRFDLEGELIMFTETDANLWIEKVNKEWEGNIPVTWFLNPSKGNEYFHTGEIETSEIKQQIITLNK